MTIVPIEADTRIATLTCARPDLLEIHYKAGVLFTPESVTEVQAARRRMMGDRSYATFTVIPTDADFTLETMREDHGDGDRGQGRILASAIVIHSSMIERLTHVYFKYFPQLQRVLVTDDEAEARAWMTAQLEEISRTGS